MKNLITFLLCSLLSTCDPVLAQVITIKKTAFIIHYDTVMKVPVYNYYEFTKLNRKVNQVIARSPSFHQEESISKRLQANDNDYHRPWDRGHYVPNDDMRFSALCEQENMTYANVAPQWNSFNEIQWRLVENYVRMLGEKYDTLQIFTGGIFGNKYTSLGRDNIAVPNYYFKTVVVKDKGKIVGGMGFLALNQPQIKSDISSYLVSIDYIEKLLGVDLYKGNNSFELQKTLTK